MVFKPKKNGFLAKKKVFFLDLDGTLYSGDRIFEGVSSILAKLIRYEKKIFFFTNNSSKNERDVAERLKKCNVEVSAEQVIISTHSIIYYFRKRFGSRIKKRFYILGNPKCKELLLRAGYQHVEPGSGSRPDAVIVGFDTTLTYEKLKNAVLYIRSGLDYYGIHPEFHCPTAEGFVPDCGSILTLLEAATHKIPKAVFGKPTRYMMLVAKERVPFNFNDAVLVGDNIDTDIQMAAHLGVTSVLVLSGETNRSELGRCSGRSVVRKIFEVQKKAGPQRAKPDYVIPAFRDLDRLL